MKKTLSELKTGDSARIVDMSLDSNYYRQKLLALGLLPGVDFVVSRVAPFGDPIEIVLDNKLSISLRRKESRSIMVQVFD